ncbi:MAG: MFS transporter [Candidatus Sumerlaeota bacterium]|nr:MFS transporter [Candidatus Sumerlaeota bacterium]
MPPDEMRRVWKTVAFAGLFGSLYYNLCIFGAPRLKFLTELHCSDFHIGLLSGMGSLALVWQIAGSMLANRFRWRRPVWMALTIFHRLLFAAVLVAPMLPLSAGWRIVWVIAVIFVHDAFLQMGAPIWLAWMSGLAPKDSITHFWASRQRFITNFNMILVTLIVIGFNEFEKAGAVITGFQLIAGLGILMGVTDVLMFLRVPDVPNEAPDSGHWLETILQPLRDREFRPFLLFMGQWHFGVFIAAPFFNLYMLKTLGWTVLFVQLLGLGAALGMAFSSRFWGLLCECYGYKPIIQVLSLLKAFIPFAFLIAPQITWLAVPCLFTAMFVDGLMNSGNMLAMQGILMKYTPARNRAMYIASANFFSIGIMSFIAPTLAGYLVDHLNHYPPYIIGAYTITGYHAAFALSMVFRLFGSRMASRIVEEPRAPMKTVLRSIASIGTFRVARWVHRLHDSSDEAQRVLAASALGALRNPLAVGGLVHALEDSSHTVRRAVAAALGHIGGRQSLKALMENLQRQETQPLPETIDALAKIGDDAAMLPLICVYHKVNDMDLRNRIVAALGKLSGTESVEEIVESLNVK